MSDDVRRKLGELLSAGDDHSLLGDIFEEICRDFKSLQQQLADEENSHQETANELRKAQEDLAGAKELLRECNNTVKALRSDLAEVQHQRDKLEQDLQKAQHERDSLLAKLEALEGQDQSAAKSDDPVLVPRGLLGAACSAIQHKRPADKVLVELRRYTTGDLSVPQPAPGQLDNYKKRLVEFIERNTSPIADDFGPALREMILRGDFDTEAKP